MTARPSRWGWRDEGDGEAVGAEAARDDQAERVVELDG